MSDEYETDVAVYEAERNRAWHSWFAARGHIPPTDEHTLIFDGGFRMAWELFRAQPSAEPGAGAEAWIPISERLPEKGVLVLVYSPPESGDWPDSVRIDLGSLDPDSDGNYWHDHGECYEHYCIVAMGGDVEFTGPGEQAPYTHWMPLPAPPAAHSAGKGEA